MNVELAGIQADFSDSVGMMGAFDSSDMLDRQGNLMNDMTAFGME